MSFSGGLTLLMGDGAETEFFSPVSKIFNVPNLGMSYEMNKITGWDSETEEYQAGLGSGSEITIELNRVFNESVQAELVAAVDNREIKNFRLGMNDGFSTETFSFTLALNEWSVLPSIESANAISISGKITKLITSVVTENQAEYGAFGSSIIERGPIIYLELDEASGTTLFDAMGLHNGTYSIDAASMTTAALSGDTGSSAVGNFSNANYITVPDNAVFQSGNPFTLSLLLNLNSSSPQTIISKWSSTTSQQSWALGVNPFGQFEYLFYEDSSLINMSSDGGVSTNQNILVHILWTGSEYSMFINGVKQSGVRASSVAHRNTSVPIIIGNTSALDSPTQGVIDDVVFYDKALTQQEITSQFQAVAT